MVNYSEPSPQSRPASTSLIKASLRIIKIHSCASQTRLTSNRSGVDLAGEFHTLRKVAVKVVRGSGLVEVIL